MIRYSLSRSFLILAVCSSLVAGSFGPITSSELIAQSVTQQQIDPHAIDEAVQVFVDREELAGAVMLVASPQAVIYHSAVGYSDIDNGRLMSPGSMFWIASQSKPMTASALMMLVDEGKINVNDPVEKYLPEFKSQMVVAEQDDQHVLLKKPTHPITIANVLSHTSGLPFQSAIEVPTLDRLPLADRVRSYAMTPLQFQPDTKYQYSNAGINTAARIIEVVSGQPFEVFLQERLLEPLGMTETTFWPSETQNAKIATSYKPGKDKTGLEATTISQLRYPLTDQHERYPMPAGGLFSTARDIACFYQMLANEGEFEGKRLLSKESVQQLTSKQTQETLPNQYGFGFSTGGNRFGHGGAYSTNSYFDKQQGLIFIWLVQHAGFPGDGAKSQEAFRAAVLQQVASP
ncbi:beta-lactamase family protein [Stieleria sp. JC731]|uniref:serine hydrolase domain-containing protein n=1 Tax=Pirellulaceae TaxID=2691357 RepID=UPI001E439113|nr:serine hydrolase domain-containing protein [Stieleria sp. JC731]MCC9600261.1 beta-lactamase family protein [Stieleria sp. JC731]